MFSDSRFRATVLTVALVFLAFQSPGADRMEMRIPDIPGYVTLKCDLHMHTVFSDGLVWPTVRVTEAFREGLDAIAISDHIEYQPHKNDLPTQHNRPHEIALPTARSLGILLVKAAEITRDTPPGHYNAIYSLDNEALAVDGFLDAIQAAKGQDAFVFWNHPGWKARPGESYRFEIHDELIEKKLIDGIEVANGGSYYKEAHQWCLDENLTMMGTSDVHSAMDPPLVTRENHRTVNLIFAKERTKASIKEALLDRRAAVWQGDHVIGREEHLAPLLRACLKVSEPFLKTDRELSFWVENISDLTFELKRTGSAGPAAVTLPAQRTVIVRLPVKKGESTPFEYAVTNLWVAPDKGLPISFTLTNE